MNVVVPDKNDNRPDEKKQWKFFSTTKKLPKFQLLIT